MTSMLEVRSLTKLYNSIPAVDRVSFTINRGEILGYVGPNGAGKSTTVKILVGLIDRSGGEILCDGRDVKDHLQSFQRRLGYIPEEAHIYPHLSGREYLQLVGRLRGMRRSILEPRIDELLRLFSLWEDRHSQVSGYSKGMRQKILISAALMHNPEFLVLDEPFSGLDASTSMVLRSLIGELAKAGKAVLYSSHVLDVVEKLCTNILILNQGRTAAYDTAARLREQMGQSSLEGVFAQLTRQADPVAVAKCILQVVQS